jgi:hypothetical protein
MDFEQVRIFVILAEEIVGSVHARLPIRDVLADLRRIQKIAELTQGTLRR